MSGGVRQGDHPQGEQPPKLEVRSWNELSELDRERLVMMYPSLDEYFCGTSLFGPALPQDRRQNLAAHRFYRNALFQYFDALFAEPNNGILPVLVSIGRQDMVDILRLQLDKPIGGSTFKGILRTWRNLGIAHLTFRAGHIVDALADANLEDPKNLRDFMDGTLFLHFVILDLRETIGKVYPAVVAFDARRPAVDNPPP